MGTKRKRMEADWVQLERQEQITTMPLFVVMTNELAFTILTKRMQRGCVAGIAEVSCTKFDHPAYVLADSGWALGQRVFFATKPVNGPGWRAKQSGRVYEYFDNQLEVRRFYAAPDGNVADSADLKKFQLKQYRLLLSNNNNSEDPKLYFMVEAGRVPDTSGRWQASCSSIPDDGAVAVEEDRTEYGWVQQFLDDVLDNKA
eukprot:jgi/Chlat1/8809/Chrsp90S00890